MFLLGLIAIVLSGLFVELYYQNKLTLIQNTIHAIASDAPLNEILTRYEKSVGPWVTTNNETDSLATQGQILGKLKSEVSTYQQIKEGIHLLLALIFIAVTTIFFFLVVVPGLNNLYERIGFLKKSTTKFKNYTQKHADTIQELGKELAEKNKKIAELNRLLSTYTDQPRSVLAALNSGISSQDEMTLINKLLDESNPVKIDLCDQNLQWCWTNRSDIAPNGAIQSIYPELEPESIEKAVNHQSSLILKEVSLSNEFDEKWKLAHVVYDEQLQMYAFIATDISDIKQNEHSLLEQVEEAKSIQKELKHFADKQLETNEKLLIAENELKYLLDKEKESKAVLNQTLNALKDTQGQLVHNEKMASLGQLTAGIAHEINNPINFIYNGIDNLKSSFEDLLSILEAYESLEQENPESFDAIRDIKEELEYDELCSDISEMIKDVKSGAIRTSEIVKGLRVFSRLDEEARKEANINECIDSTVVLLRNKTKNKIEIIRQLDSDLPSIWCYPGQLNQVFMNMIMNAIQAMPEDKKDGVIMIQSESTEDNVCITIRDNGSGMSPEVMNRIFEPFYTTKPVGVGTGLGMSISYGIIEKHGGKIEVKSQLGEGTEFKITLPQKVNEEYLSAVS